MLYDYMKAFGRKERYAHRDSHFGVYYHVDDERELVTVLAIEDERMDPIGRFAPMEETRPAGFRQDSPTPLF